MKADRKIDSAAKGYLVSTYSGKEHLPLCKDYLDELEFLAETYGIETVCKDPCPLRKINASTYISKGKIEAILGNIAPTGANLIIFDEEISPAQQRNLEKAFGIPVIDRTELILAVFAQRAQTKEAVLQVELAQLKYQYPRLKRMWTHLSRQVASAGGAGAYLKGAGEKQIEIDKRLLQKRIEVLEQRLAEVAHHREIQRAARKRSSIPVFAIVGYTNAGKSTLLNALTDADVFVEDKLFATLDTTTRKFQLSNKQKILLIDTVGFIRKLPHLLVASFKSTLEEAAQADILLHVIDVSHPLCELQAESSWQVLEELNAAKKPVITVLNKVDHCENQGAVTRMRVKYPNTVPISALNQAGFDSLEEAIVNELSKQRKHFLLRIPQSDYAMVNEIMIHGHILKKDYQENDVLIEAEIPVALVGKVEKYVDKGGDNEDSEFTIL